MFYKKFDEISNNLTRFFITKKAILETAQQFDELARTQDEENPFECGLVALARFGEMQCYQKNDDKPRTVRTAVKAARLFIRSATFNYEISRNLRDTWSDPLADGLHCYRVAVDTLKSDGKPNLAAVLLLELGKTEAQFDLFHYAGNSYEEAVELCIEKQLPPTLLFESISKCCEAFFKANRLDLALLAIERVVQKTSSQEAEIVKNSPLMAKQFVDLRILKAQLLLCAFKHDKCLEYARENLDKGVVELFTEMVNATKSHQIAVISGLIDQARASDVFTPLHIDLFERHMFLLSSNVEAAFAEISK